MNDIEILNYFPEKSFFPYQKESILNIYDNFLNGSEIVFYEGPFGLGKTVIAKTFANMFKKTYYLTASKGLQKQLITKYPDIKQVKGSDNFPCLIDPKKTKAKAICTIDKERCDHKPIREANTLTYDFDNLCDYWKQKVEAIESKISAHNYDYMITELKYVGDFRYPRSTSHDLKELSLGIFDEAHNIGIKVLHHFDIVLTRTFLSSCSISFPFYETPDKWIEWLIDLNSVQIPYNMKELTDLYKTSTSEATKESCASKLESLESLSQRINVLLKHYNANKHMWIFVPKLYDDNTMQSLKVIPIIVSPFVEDTLFQYFDKKLLMSSTILDPYIMINDLGLKGRKMNYVRYPCPFPLENRPIYPLNIGRLDYESRSANMDSVVKAIEIIMELFPEKKGIIHSNSFTINNYITDYIKRSCFERIVTHSGKGTKNYQHSIQEHIESDYPSVICSPSLIEGIDLPGKLAEFQIIVSLFYDNINESPQLQERQRIEPLYYQWLASVKTIQATGRPLRGMSDICPTFYLDSRFNYFVLKNKSLLSQWWTSAIQPTPHKYSYISDEATKITKDKK